MTRQNNRGRKGLSRETFKDIKLSLETSSVSHVAQAFGYSETTVRRVKKSSSYSEYKGYIAASNGNKQFNENEFEKNLKKITDKPAHASYHHYQNQPIVEDDEISTGLVIFIALVLVTVVGLLGWALVSLFSIFF